jgi:hypothetical protein
MTLARRSFFVQLAPFSTTSLNLDSQFGIQDLELHRRSREGCRGEKTGQRRHQRQKNHIFETITFKENGALGAIIVVQVTRNFSSY